MDKLLMLLCGGLGIFFHLLIKARSLQKTANAVNTPFGGIGEIFKKDWVEIMMAVISVLALFFTFDEILSRYPSLQDFAKLFFLSWGYCGSSVMMHFFSKTEKALKKGIDTNLNSLTMYQWVFTFETASDTILLPTYEEAISLQEYSDNRGIPLSMVGSTPQIISPTLPDDDELIVVRPNTTTYVARPVRRPV